MTLLAGAWLVDASPAAQRPPRSRPTIAAEAPPKQRVTFGEFHGTRNRALRTRPCRHAPAMAMMGLPLRRARFLHVLKIFSLELLASRWQPHPGFIN